MPEFLSQNKDLLDVLVQALIIVVPIAVSWLLRNFIRASATEKDMAAIVRLSNAAIDFVENLDRRGDLVLPPEVKKGGYKLKLAAQWMESELQRAGIRITDEQAQQWIASEFQKRMGGVQPVVTIAELTRAAVDLIQNMEQNRLVQLPPNADRTPFLASLAADWLVAQLARDGKTISREEAITWIRAELLQRLQSGAVDLPVQDPLDQLAGKAMEFLDVARAGGWLAAGPGVPPDHFEADIVTASLLTEAVRHGLAVSPQQIGEAVSRALSLRQPAAVHQPETMPQTA